MQHTAERARHQDIDLCPQHLGRVEQLHADLARVRAGGHLEIRAEDLGSFREQTPCERQPHGPETLQGNAHAMQRVHPDVLQSCGDPPQRTLGGGFLGRAQHAVMEMSHPLRRLGQMALVVLVEARVGAGAVDAAEAFDGAPQRVHRLAPVPQVVGQHHGLASAAGDPGQHALEGHGLRQPQGVQGRLVLVAVAPDPNAAVGGPAAGVVQGDPGAQTGCRILDRDELLVARQGHGLEEFHAEVARREARHDNPV